MLTLRWALALPGTPSKGRPAVRASSPLGGKAQSDSGGDFISYLAQGHHRAAGTVEKGAAFFAGL